MNEFSVQFVSTDGTDQMIRCDGQRVNPATVPVVASHDRANHRIFSHSDEEQSIVECDLLVDDMARFIMHRLVTENALSQRDHLTTMLSVLERRDRHRCHVSRRITLEITWSRLLLHSKLAIRSSANLRLGFMGKEITPSRWMF